jgi:hypothetical protein
MRFICPCCNHAIRDSTDNIPYKARVVPDQNWFPVLGDIDGIVREAATGEMDDEGIDDAQWRVRTVLYDVLLPLFQCQNCGGFVIYRDKKVFGFQPVDPATPKTLLGRREKSPPDSS